MKTAFCAVAALAAAIATSRPCEGQRVLFESTPQQFTGSYGYFQHGYSVARAGDIDGDGHEDYWMGAPDLDSAPDSIGFVSLCSGADGSVLRVLAGGVMGQNFGFCLAGGVDLSGDGVPDLLVGAPSAGAPAQPGAVHAVSGADGTPLYSVPGLPVLQGFGRSLAFLGDVDGDGVREFAVGAPDADLGGVDRGTVIVLSGASGAFLGITSGSADGSHHGHALASAGDVDADGCEDLLVGAPQGGPLGAGTVRLLSGRTGAALRTLSGSAVGDGFGFSVGGAGDLSGDGVPDIVVGVPGARAVRTFSGADGMPLWSETRTRLEPQHPGFWPHADFGWSVCGIGDQDGDGRDDVAVGYPDHASVWFFSGSDGAELGLCASAYVQPVSADSLLNFFGWSLARLSDLDGDGRAELLAGAPQDDVLNGYPNTYELGSAAVLAPAVRLNRIRQGQGPGTASSVARAGDLDGDGWQDLAFNSQGGVEIVSGRTRAPLRTLPAFPPSHPQGLDAGDVDADGLEDLVVAGSPVRVFSGASGLVLPGFAGESAGAVSALGDLDGDGHTDLGLAAAVGHPGGGFPCSGAGFAGRVRVVSGASGALLFQLDGLFWDVFSCGLLGESFGYSLSSAGDWNRDGVPDIAVGAPAAGTIRGGAARVFSGTDGAVLREFLGQGGDTEFGISVSGGPGFDFNADGWVDLVVGEQLIGYGPHGSTGGAQVFSGADGSVLGGFAWNEPLGYGREVGPGYTVLALADYDLDGFSDFAASNPAARSVLGPGAGEVVVVSGRTHSIVQRVTGTSSWDYLGYSLASLGNADGNGATGFLIGSPAGVPSSFSNLPTTNGTAVLVRRPGPRATRLR